MTTPPFILRFIALYADLICSTSYSELRHKGERGLGRDVAVLSIPLLKLPSINHCTTTTMVFVIKKLFINYYVNQ